MLDFLQNSHSLSEFSKSTFQFVCADASIDLEKLQVLDAVARFLETELMSPEYEVDYEEILASSKEEIGQLMYDMWMSELEFPSPVLGDTAFEFFKKLVHAYIRIHYESLLIVNCESKTVGNSSYKIVELGDGNFGIQETFYDEGRGLIKDETGFDCSSIAPLILLLEDIQEEKEVISLFSEDSLFMFLAKFCAENEWTNEWTKDLTIPNRASALFAAICMYHGINRGSQKMQLLLEWLYDHCKATDCVPYQSFSSFMIRLL